MGDDAGPSAAALGAVADEAGDNTPAAILAPRAAPPASEQLLSITVSEPVKREQTGVFGMKGTLANLPFWRCQASCNNVVRAPAHAKFAWAVQPALEQLLSLTVSEQVIGTTTGVCEVKVCAMLATCWVMHPTMCH